jgi:hypothetical protein
VLEEQGGVDEPGEECLEGAEVLVDADGLQPLAQRSQVTLHGQRGTRLKLPTNCFVEAPHVSSVDTEGVLGAVRHTAAEQERLYRVRQVSACFVARSWNRRNG